MNIRPYVVPNNGCNNPIQSPLFQSPFVPYSCINARCVSVWAEVEPELIKKYLAPTPFEYVSNVFNIMISDYNNATGFRGFCDCSFVIPVCYKGLYGGYTIFEYENDDFCIAAGREMWGYPKVFGEINVTESIDKVVGTVRKRGKEVVRVEVDITPGQNLTAPKVALSPAINLVTIPRGEAPGGILLQRVVQRNTSPDCDWHTTILGEAALTLRFDGTHPFDEFASAKIICGDYTRGEFAATNENGWSRAIEDIIWPEEF